MVTKTDKKNAIRQGIVNAAIVYSQNLGGKTFLYVYGDEYFEVSFPIDHFLHLTGVETRLSAKDFYKNAKKSILTNNQFYFDVRHVTNLEFTLGLTENIDNNGNKINDLFLPMSLRVKDSSVERSNDGDVIDFIYFSKDASVAKYDALLVEDKGKTIPSCIKHLINDGFCHETNE